MNRRARNNGIEVCVKGPTEQSGFQVWSDQLGAVEVRFVGCQTPPGKRLEPPAVLEALGERVADVAWARQVHSAQVLRAAPGLCGEADALVSGEAGLALTIFTADCVPILLADSEATGSPPGGPRIAAVHAGWRGLASGVIAQTLDRLGGSASRWVAWIGPAIGPCCYEVEDEVVEAVAVEAGGRAGLASPGPRGRPHLHLQAAAARQLAAAGVKNVRRVEACTRCHDDLLFSYRREGPGGGRNYSLIWSRD